MRVRFNINRSFLSMHVSFIHQPINYIYICYYVYLIIKLNSIGKIVKLNDVVIMANNINNLYVNIGGVCRVEPLEFVLNLYSSTRICDDKILEEQKRFQKLVSAFMIN